MEQQNVEVQDYYGFTIQPTSVIKAEKGEL